MKKIRFLKFLVALVIVPMLTLCVSAAGSDTIKKEQSQKSGAAGLYQKTPDNTKSALGELGINSPDSSSLLKFTPAGLFKIAVKKLKSEATKPLKAVTAIFGILLACALLNTMKNSFGEKPLKSVFDIVCTLCVAAVLMVPISSCISSAAATIKQSSTFMIAFLPVFTSLVAASGHPASAVVSQSLLLVSSQVITEIMTTTFVPMVNIFLAFCIVGSVSPGINIAGIAGFSRKLVEWGLTLCLTIFAAMLTIQGLIAQAADSVTIKTAKFVVGSVVPVIGGSISDAVNTVVSCAGLLKTATGAYAIIVFVLAFLQPVLDCLLWMLAADLSLAVAEMLGIGNIAGMMKSVKEALKLLMAMVLACALTMIISISIMLLLGLNS